jgi:hypothetical protein
MRWAALEEGLPVHAECQRYSNDPDLRSISLPCWLIQLHADPYPSFAYLCFADEAHRSYSSQIRRRSFDLTPCADDDIGWSGGGGWRSEGEGLWNIGEAAELVGFKMREDGIYCQIVRGYSSPFRASYSSADSSNFSTPETSFHSPARAVGSVLST